MRLSFANGSVGVAGHVVAISLLESLLHFDPALRCSAHEALNHPYFQAAAPPPAPPPPQASQVSVRGTELGMTSQEG